MTPEQKRIWYEWRKMHFHIQTLNITIEGQDPYTSAGWVEMNNECDELNTQMAELEDENIQWLPAMIANEF
jgi:hypothetical protein